VRLTHAAKIADFRDKNPIDASTHSHHKDAANFYGILVEAGELNRPQVRRLLPRKCLILLQTQALLVIFRKITASPKRPEKASAIAKNRTGSGPPKQGRGTNNWNSTLVVCVKFSKMSQVSGHQFFSFSVRPRFFGFRPNVERLGAARSGPQGWPKATAARRREAALTVRARRYNGAGREPRHLGYAAWRSTSFLRSRKCSMLR
jgi:hypothetical protein